MADRCSWFRCLSVDLPCKVPTGRGFVINYSKGKTEAILTPAEQVQRRFVKISWPCQTQACPCMRKERMQDSKTSEFKRNIKYQKDHDFKQLFSVIDDFVDDTRFSSDTIAY